MYTHSKTIFNHLLEFVDRQRFDYLVGQQKTDKGKKKFSTWDLFICLLVAQIRQSDSIRSLKTDMMLHKNTWYHMWSQWIKRSTFSDWNKKVSPKVFEEMYFHFLKYIQQTWGEKWVNKWIYAIDATLITLTLSVFNWASYKKKKGALKIHTRLDYQTWMPDVVVMTEGKVHESKTIEEMTKDLWVWSIVIFDRWYVNYKAWDTLTDRWIEFITRTKKNMSYSSEWIAKTPNEIGILYDEKVWLYMSEKKYPRQLRVVRYMDEKEGKIYEYVTNKLDWTGKEIADLYKQRRDIEKLFRWLKQNLCMQTFLWYSENAVQNQVWVALIYFALVQYIKAKTRCKESLRELTWKLKSVLFERQHILAILGISSSKVKEIIEAPPDLGLFAL